MRKCCSTSVLCALAFVASASALLAQTPAPSPPSDPAITPLSVMGVVTNLNRETNQVIVTTANGNAVTVTIGDRTEFMRIPPGEKSKDKFVKITPADFAVGDSVFARGRMSADRRSMPALEFYVMSKGDIAQKREREREEWRTRGIAGAITSLNPEARTISIDARTANGPKPIVLTATANTTFRRYAPDSVRFADAKTSSFADLKVGDQLRALGSKNADGTQFTPEEIVSGSFQTIGGTITEINAAAGEIKINDQQSHQQITIVVSKDSLLRRLNPELLAVLSSRPGTTNSPTQSKEVSPKSSGDLQELFDQLPVLTLQELKQGESLLISSTKGSNPTRVTAIAVVSGVEPLLRNPQAGGPVSLGAMSLGGP